MRSETILIVTEKFDFHVDRIVPRLKSMGHQPIRLSIQEFAARSLMSVEIDSGKATTEFESGKHSFDLASVKSIYWRRPAGTVPNEALSAEHKVFARAEFVQAFEGIWATSDCFWMSFPSRIREAGYKVEQLARAARMGFDTPRTIVTTDASRALAFFDAVNGNVIYKPLSSTILRDAYPDPDRENGSVSDMIFTTALTKEQLTANSEGIRNAPCMFQEKIPKRLELRVTVIGDEIFVAEIDSQAQERTRLDWRHYDVPMLFKKGHLPDRLIERCFKLVKSYGLNYSAMDFIVTPEGQYVFLENNPNGQFMFVEDLIPEFRMTDALLDCLIRGAPGKPDAKPTGVAMAREIHGSGEL